MKFSTILLASFMREAQFLKQNAEKWKRYEQEINQFDNPDVFAERFVEITDDLAYARTFYNGSNTAKYLNGLAALFHQKIYRNKKEKSSRIWAFWQFELPYLFKQYHKELLYAFVFFIVFCLIGALSASQDETFVRSILGDPYVNMTIENIERGDPFGVYRQEGEVNMFVGIAFNNIYVSFFVFVKGIIFTVGTLQELMRNGIMVGAFLEFFFKHDLGAEAILAVFIHGTIELSIIVIAGCAGIILGNSLLFPGTYNRWLSLRMKARDAMKIVFGLVPFFMLAAFLEGFVTRHYNTMPLWLNIFILAGSFVLLIWYFIIRPIQLNKRITNVIENGGTDEKENFQLWLTKKLSSEK